MPKRQRTELLGKFKNGELTHMVNCNILTEGFDCPEIECVAMLRRTDSRAMFVQCLGRGLRLAPEINKADCLYLDLTLDMPDHSLEGPEDALDGYDLDSFWNH
jgi:ATP-dependent helicase IRC3